MSLEFPSLPIYSLSWRSIFVEPIPGSSEKIAACILAKGNDGAYIGISTLPISRLNHVFGKQLSAYLSNAINICLASSKAHYSSRPLSSAWNPPISGVSLGAEREFLAENIDEAVLELVNKVSSLRLGFELDKAGLTVKSMSTEDWRSGIAKLVSSNHKNFQSSFNKEVSLSGHGVPIKIGFISEKYAAQFGVINAKSKFSDALMRAQSKLWQLERLRDSNHLLFKPKKYELIFHRPQNPDKKIGNSVEDFIGELKYEAEKAELGLAALNTREEAAQRIIRCAA